MTLSRRDYAKVHADPKRSAAAVDGALKRSRNYRRIEWLEKKNAKLVEALKAIVDSAMDEGGEQLYVGQQNIEQAVRLLSELGEV